MRVEVLQDGADAGDHVVLGPDAEVAVVHALVARGAQRVLIVAMSRHPQGAERLAALLGERSAGTFLTEVPQVPGEVADAAVAMARDLGVDWVIAHGGGTAIGVAKAVALVSDVQVAAVPTTYAGSERTDIWGLTRDGVKTTGRNARVRPRIVGYDPALTQKLPLKLSLQSLLNALAHSIDALFDADAAEAGHIAASASLSVLWRAIAALQQDPEDLDARSLATRGAWLASEALNGAKMALHHKLAHVLGGSHDMPHAPTHAALLPHTLQFNLSSAPEVHRQLTNAFAAADPAAALYDRMRTAGLAVSLRELKLPLDALGDVREQVLAKRYANPRPISDQVLHLFLLDLWQGRRPSVHARRWQALSSGGAHGEQRPAVLGPAVGDARKVVLAVHGRGANADRFAADLQRRMGTELAATTTIVALQADQCTWYPHGFRTPVQDNQPQMDHALAAIDAAWQAVRLYAEASDIVVVGFSQGACLLLTWLQRTAARPRYVLAFSGAHTPLPGNWAAARGAHVHLGTAVEDPWIPPESFDESVAAVGEHAASVAVHRVPGAQHTIHPHDDAALRCALEA
jgi:maleylacetate reductase